MAPAKGTIRFVGTGRFLSAVPSTSSALEDGAGDDLPGGGPPLPGANHDFQGEASLTTSQGTIFRCLTEKFDETQNTSGSKLCPREALTGRSCMEL